jgi:hypothetical protein
VLTQDVFTLRQVTDANDDDLAQAAAERRLPAHRIGVIEPALGKRWSVQQRAVDIEQAAAPPRAQFFNETGKLGMLVFLDECHASHG